MKTFLFDIDGTLLRTGGAGLHAMQRAMAELFEISALAKVEVRGRTDRGILRDLFTAHQIADSTENWDAFQQAYLRHLPQSLRALPGYLLPGVEATLAAIRDANLGAVGLLTGNVKRAAEIKLSHFAVNHHFAFGGFGDHSSCRNDVAQQALDSAKNYLNAHFEADQVWVIGDTPLDISCGRAIEARTVGVLTGGYDRATLTAAAPDILLEDLRDFPRALAALA
jgi:phosphoglycolate phosphatase-like HAD superfamily hydrolase